MKRLESPRRVLVQAGMAAGLTAVGLAVGTSPASAAGSNLLVRVPGDPAGWTASPTVAMFSADNLAPGQTVVGTIGLRNTSAAGGILGLEFTDVKGALAGELQYSVGPAGDPSESRAESLSALEQGLVLPQDLGAGTTTFYRIAVTFPAAADNEWADRSSAFDVVWTLSETGLTAAGSGSGSPDVGPGSPVVAPGSSSPGAPGVAGGLPAPRTAGRTSSVAVAGMGSPSPVGEGPSGALAFTGGAVMEPLEIGAAVLAAGALIVLGVRRRRTQTEP